MVMVFLRKEFTKMEMQGKEITQEELEKNKWEYTGMTIGFTYKLFRKGKERILWDSQNQTVSLQWLEEKK